MEKTVIQSVLKKINGLLVDKNYNLLYQLDVNKRITADEIEEAISEYGGEVTFPPVEAFDKIHVYEYDDDKDEVMVESYLWIDGEESDLTLSCEIVEYADGVVYFSLDDIHVL